MVKEKAQKFQPHEGNAPLSKVDDPSPWLEIEHTPIWLDAVSPEGKEQLVCGECAMRKDKE